MISRDLVPMARECAGPRGTGKPLQIAVDSVPGTTEGDKAPPSGQPHYCHPDETTSGCTTASPRSVKCRSCRKGRYTPSVRMIKLTERQEITPSKWIHPSEDDNLGQKGSLVCPSSQSITWNIIPRASIADSRSAACFFHSGVSRTRKRGSWR